MSMLTTLGFFLTAIISISTGSCIMGSKTCGTYPLTFCCPVNTRCGSYETRTCYMYSESRKPPVAGIVFFVIISVIILIMVLKACITCFCSRNGYEPLPPNRSADLARSGAVVCITATHC